MDRCRYRRRGGGWKENGRSAAISHGGEDFPGAMGRPHSPFILCYNKGNATWAAVASKEGKDET